MKPQIFLKSSHLYLDNELVTKVFKNADYAYLKYASDQKKILIAPSTSKWFFKMFNPTLVYLKTRSLKGDKALPIRALLIDYGLDESDRVLEYELIDKTSLIKVAI